jgi:hypothetical protein
MVDYSRISEGLQQPYFEKVSGENPDNIKKINVDEVEALFEAINKYNLQFTKGARALINTEEKPTRLVKSTLLKERASSEGLLAINFSYEDQQIVDQIGLKLEPVITDEKKIFASDSTCVDGRELRLNIVDEKKFVSFLGLLGLEQVVNTDIEHNLKDLSKMLTNQILQQFGFSSPTSEGFELLSNMPEIIENYKRLGLADSIEKMEIYLIHIRQGDMKEYVEIEKAGLFLGPDDNDWGPAKWQNDATSRILKDHWGRALEVVKVTGVNPKARELYKKLLNHLKYCAENASQDVINNPHIEQKSEFLDILEGVKSELSGML